MIVLRSWWGSYVVCSALGGVGMSLGVDLGWC